MSAHVEFFGENGTDAERQLVKEYGGEKDFLRSLPVSLHGVYPPEKLQALGEELIELGAVKQGKFLCEIGSQGIYMETYW